MIVVVPEVVLLVLVVVARQAAPDDPLVEEADRPLKVARNRRLRRAPLRSLASRSCCASDRASATSVTLTEQSVNLEQPVVSTIRATSRTRAGRCASRRVPRVAAPALCRARLRPHHDRRHRHGDRHCAWPRLPLLRQQERPSARSSRALQFPARAEAPAQRLAGARSGRSPDRDRGSLFGIAARAGGSPSPRIARVTDQPDRGRGPRRRDGRGHRGDLGLPRCPGRRR